MKPLIAFTLAVLLFSACQNRRSAIQRKPGPELPAMMAVSPVREDSICIAAVGDIMLGTSYPDSNSLPADSAVNSFKVVAAELRKSDLAFGNLEGTLLDSGDPATYKLHQRSKAYLFRMPVKYGRLLRDAGFDVLSMANNHSGDFGERGRKSTMRALDSCGIHYAGLLQHPVSVFKISKVTYGFCAFAPNSNTVSIFDLQNAARIIKDLKQRCDIVIVSFHGGGEGAGFEHVTKQPETYLGERRGDVFAFARNAIDAGADLVFGNGPHVSRAMEVYKNRLIAYSLGNFCTYKCVSIEGICGQAPLLKVYVNKKGEFLSGRILSFRQNHLTGLQTDTLNKVSNRIRLLTGMDLPDAGLVIADDGSITKVARQDTLAIAMR